MSGSSLFPELELDWEAVAQENERRAPGVPGLRYVPEFVTPQQEAELLAAVDEAEWLTELQRRVQHYGYKYDYRGRRIDDSMKLGPLPGWLEDRAAELVRRGIVAEQSDQVIVNEYYPGQGISAHVDCEPCFEDGIVSLTLGSGCAMEFTLPGGKEVVTLYLQPRSLVVLTGAARYEWRHAIAKRQKDTVLGRVVARERRVSLTFRRVAAQRP